MKKFVIVDIDGTIADISHRVKYVETKPKNWDKFFAELNKDKPITHIIELVENLSKNYNIIFCTGRAESLREETQEFIWKYCHDLDDVPILMRADNDRRPDHFIKPALLIKNGYTTQNVAFILDDRSSVVKAFRDLGYICLQVKDGDY